MTEPINLVDFKPTKPTRSYSRKRKSYVDTDRFVDMHNQRLSVGDTCLILYYGKMVTVQLTRIRILEEQVDAQNTWLFGLIGVQFIYEKPDGTFIVSGMGSQVGYDQYRIFKIDQSEEFLVEMRKNSANG